MNCNFLLISSLRETEVKLFMISYLQKTMGQIFQMESADAVVEKHYLECFVINSLTSPIYIHTTRSGLDVSALMHTNVYFSLE